MNIECKGIRKNIIKLCHVNGGHLGGSLSVVEILYTLYKFYYSQENPNIIVSKGHSAVALYSTLYQLSIISKSLFNSYGKDGSLLTGHVNNNVTGTVFSSGALGNGLGVGLGLVIADNLRRVKNQRKFVVISDGELNEGSTFEALVFAGHNKLSITAILDLNGVQASDYTKNILDTKPILRSINQLGWKVIFCDGHSISALRTAIKDSLKSPQPVIIVAKTIKGRGVSFMENTTAWHHAPLSKEQYKIALQELL